MIHHITSDLPGFKDLEFQPGLNLLLADKSPGATDRQTRNGAGKSSLIEVIHFLTGSDREKDSIFRKELEPWKFTMDFDIGGKRVEVARSGLKPSQIFILAGDTSGWPITPMLEHPTFDLPTGGRSLSNTQWRTVLGSEMFGLRNGEGEEGTPTKFGPTFRSLFTYFVRRDRTGGFISPFKHTEEQKLWDQQVALSFLLGLDWTTSQQWQIVRESEISLKVLRKAARGGAFGSVIASTADLRTRLAVAEENARRIRGEIENYKVLESYRDLEIEASDLTSQISDLSDQDTLDLHLLSELREAVASEAPPPVDDLQQLYREAGIALPDVALRRFDQVRQFHESVIETRKSYLNGEIKAAEGRIAERLAKKERLTERRAEVMRLLQSHGALDHFSRLQGELNRREAEVETLRHRFDAAEQIEGSKTVNEIKRNQLLLRLRQDYQEQRETLNDAIVAFENISEAHYEEENAGSLMISESLNGPIFNVEIHGNLSGGISRMQIFCFDMLLMRLCSERGIGPGFLIHDSHLFDGVDERQVGKALQVGAQMAEELGFQYVVTMNSDVVPTDLPKGFNLDDFILPVRLTDATEDGGLFGMRFR